MTSVGVRQFKAHLSAYVRSAREGESVTITDRGVVVARLVPAASESALQRLVDAGLASPPSSDERSRPRPRDVGAAVSDLVTEQRR